MGSTPRREPITHIVAAVATLALAAGCGGAAAWASSASTYCASSATGHTALAAAARFVSKCGPSYKLGRGPYDADKATSPYADYAQVVEFTIRVTGNSEGTLGFLLVGRRTRHAPWRTLGSLGTGP